MVLKLLTVMSSVSFKGGGEPEQAHSLSSFWGISSNDANSLTVGLKVNFFFVVNIWFKRKLW